MQKYICEIQVCVTSRTGIMSKSGLSADDTTQGMRESCTFLTEAVRVVIANFFDNKRLLLIM